MGYSKDFKDKVIEIMARDQLSVRKAAQHFGCMHTYDTAMEKIDREQAYSRSSS